MITPINVFYIARKFSNAGTARRLVDSLLNARQVCSPDREALIAALRLPGGDYEDAVQVVSAQGATLDALVTRDPHDYQGVSFPIYSPAAFLEQLTD